jgi:hypothetical protein
MLFPKQCIISVPLGTKIKVKAIRGSRELQAYYREIFTQKKLLVAWGINNGWKKRPRN